MYFFLTNSYLKYAEKIQRHLRSRYWLRIQKSALFILTGCERKNDQKVQWFTKKTKLGPTHSGRLAGSAIQATAHYRHGTATVLVFFLSISRCRHTSAEAEFTAQVETWQQRFKDRSVACSTIRKLHEKSLDVQPQWTWGKISQWEIDLPLTWPSLTDHSLIIWAL